MNQFDFEYIVQLRNEGQYAKAMLLLEAYISNLEKNFSLSNVEYTLPISILINYAKALGQKAILFRYLGDIEKAKFFTLKAIPFAEQSKELELLGLLISDYGVYQYKSGNVEDAERNFKKAVQILEAIESKKQLVIVKINYGCMLLHLGEFEQCIPLFKQTLLELETQGDSPELGSLLTNLAYAYENIGKTELALMTYARAKELLFRIKAIPMYVLSSINLVALYNEEEMYELAKAVLDEIEQYISTEELSNERIDYLINYIGYYIGIDSINDAIKILNEISSLDLKDIEPESKVYMLLLWSRIYIRTENISEAKKYAELIKQDITSFSKPEIEPFLYWLNGKIAILELEYEFAAKCCYKGLNECTFSKPGTKIYRDLQQLQSEIYSLIDKSKKTPTLESFLTVFQT
ncbi:MAG: hypothetical protein JNL36_12335 [Candidatus Kapabacteria bacterium]|nr:hypothetical protein [Candidatus Kapabacteria bacterium]